MSRPLARAFLQLTLATSLFAGIACAGNRPEDGSRPDAGAGLEVRNLGFPDMTVYAVTPTGSRVRLGLVTGHSTQRFDLPARLVRGGDRLRFLADPIGGSRAPVSEELYVAPGDLVTLTIPPQ